jgi:VanZ family protein
MSVHRGRLALAIAVSAVVVLAAPYIGQLRAFIQDTFPGQYSRIIAAAVFGSVGAAIVVAIARIRERRALRYGLIAVALAIGTAYAMLSTSGDPTVDAVERFHFVEYGLVAFLFYRAWQPAGDLSVLVLPVLAGLLTGICEEWLQWFVPSRVGELRDVVLNLWAVVCGLIFGLGLDPPERLSWSLAPHSRTRIRRFTAIVLLAFGIFMQSVHLGYRIDDGQTGAFRSMETAEGLDALARDRTERWRANPPMTWSRLSREDQYMTEGVTHVRRRNICWGSDWRCAWHENLILERYFAPVLDTPSYISPTGHRWDSAQRADAEARIAEAPASADGAYISAADKDSPVFTWSRTLFWSVIVAAMAILVWPSRIPFTRS